MRRKIQTIIFVPILAFAFSCKENKSKTSLFNPINSNNVKTLIKKLNTPTGKDVLVVAHRGDWRNFPENSLEAIQSCIEMGVDMVEIDLAKTQDGKLVVMHDKTLNRTTTGNGLVSEWSLQAIKTLSLKNGAGVPTTYKVPTLMEALNVCKGKILINLDKSYEYFNEVYKIAQKTGTTHQIIIKGSNKTADEVVNDFGKKLDTIIFMPVINLDELTNTKKIIEDYQNKLKVKAFEFVFSTDTSMVINNFKHIKQNGSRIWVNSLWSSLNAGYDDNNAIKNPDSIYGWYIKKGINIIQTDRPKLLLDFLRNKNLHE